MATGVDGVIVKKLVRHSDNRGYFMEILRDDDGLLSKFGQSAVSLTKPGIVKAFHWHRLQDDFFFVAAGRALVGLYDCRDGSPTFGAKQSIVVDENEPVLIFIPRGVAHGYKVLGDRPVLMFYHMTENYNASEPDEGRIDADDPSIGFDWKQAD